MKNHPASIFQAVNEFRLAIGEIITSADLDTKVFVFDCDDSFDPAIMEEAYGDYRQSSGKRAPEAIVTVSTTSMGLAKVIAERSVKDAHQTNDISGFKSCQY